MKIITDIMLYLCIFKRNITFHNVFHIHIRDIVLYTLHKISFDNSNNHIKNNNNNNTAKSYLITTKQIAVENHIIKHFLLKFSCFKNVFFLNCVVLA